jgi:teichuronic acid biosynthesis protein TuaE
LSASASPHAGHPPSAATAAALLGLGVVATAGLTAFALRGHAPRVHLAIALGLPLAAALALVVVATRRRLARVRLSRALVVAVVALPALAILGPALALPHLTQAFAFRVVLGLVGFWGLVWLILVRRHWRFEATTYALLFGIWFCWLVITLAWAPSPGLGPHYLLLLAALGAAAAATASAGLSRRRLTYVLLGLAAVYGLSLLVGAVEVRLHLHLPTASPLYKHRGEPAAFFYNTNDFGTYLALCWPFALLLPLWRRRPAVIALAALTLLATFGLLLFTRSRTSLLAIVLETAVVAVVVASRAGRRMRIAVVVVAVIAMIGVGLLLAGRAGGSFDIAKVVSQAQSGSGSGGVRSELQFAGLRAASTRWFLGVGPGNAESIVARQNPQFTVLNLHDWWLETFVDGGLPGLLLFLTLYLLLLGAMVRVARYARDALLRYLGAAMAIALVGFFVAIVGPSTAINFPPMAILFGLGLAVLIRARRDDSETAADLVPADGSPPPASRPDLLDSRTDPDGVATEHHAARWPALDGGDADPAGDSR